MCLLTLKPCSSKAYNPTIISIVIIIIIAIVVVIIIIVIIIITITILPPLPYNPN